MSKTTPLPPLIGINRICELSCDETVVRALDEEQRRLYGNRRPFSVCYKLKTVSCLSQQCQNRFLCFQIIMPKNTIPVIYNSIFPVLSDYMHRSFAHSLIFQPAYPALHICFWYAAAESLSIQPVGIGCKSL